MDEQKSLAVDSNVKSLDVDSSDVKSLTQEQTPNTVIIGISGKLGVGKDWFAKTVLKPLLESYRAQYLFMAFANQIKIRAVTSGLLEHEEAFGIKTAKSRNILRNIGQSGREIKSDIWIRHIDEEIKLYSENVDVFVIKDVRFQDEADFIKSLGGLLIRVEAPERNKERLVAEVDTDPNHISETALDAYTDWDLVFHNDTPSNLLDVFQNLNGYLKRNLMSVDNRALLLNTNLRDLYRKM